jgi:hypothetical protein
MDENLYSGDYVTVGDPGQQYWDMQPITPTYDYPIYDYNNYDSTAFDQYGNYPTDNGTGYDNGSGGPVYSPYQYPTNSYGGSPYDDNGNLMPGWATDENNNPVYTGDSTYNDQTGTTASGNNPYGQTVYNPDGTTTYYPPGANVPGQQQPGVNRSIGTQQPQASQQPRTGQQQPQQPGQQQNRGILGSIFGGDQTGGGNGGSSGLLGTLGMLAAGAGVGALLSNMLGNKASGGSGSVTPAHAASIGPGNLSYTQLANPGTNPGYAMGASSAPVSGLTTNLGRLNTSGPYMNPIQQSQPQPQQPVAPTFNSAPAIASPELMASFSKGPAPVNPTGMTGQPLSLDQVKSMIGM